MRRNSVQRVKARRETAVRILEKAIKAKQGNPDTKQSLERQVQELATIQERIKLASPVRKSLKRKPKKVKTDDIFASV